MMFFLGLFIGGTIGLFIAAALAAGKSCDSEEEHIKSYETAKLKFMLYGNHYSPQCGKEDALDNKQNKRDSM